MSLTVKLYFHFLNSLFSGIADSPHLCRIEQLALVGCVNPPHEIFVGTYFQTKTVPWRSSMVGFKWFCYLFHDVTA